MLALEKKGNVRFGDRTLYRVWRALSKKLLKHKFIEGNFELDKKLHKILYAKKEAILLIHSFDKRLNEMGHQLAEINRTVKFDKRFDAIDQKLAELDQSVKFDKRFDVIDQKLVELDQKVKFDERFDKVDQKLIELEQSTKFDKRFDVIDQKLAELDQRAKFDERWNKVDQKLTEIDQKVQKAVVLASTQAKPAKSAKTAPNSFLSAVSSAKPNPMHKKFIACQGFFYSGSSALIGLFREFDNTTVMGYPDDLYSASQVSDLSTEIRFFKNSRLFPLIDAFYNKSPLEQDVLIKKFIVDIYTCYERKGLFSWDKNPELYNDYFLYNSLRFLNNILDLDDYTEKYMKDRKFPVIRPSDSEFLDCCFLFDKNDQQYVVYKFKKLSLDEFDKYVHEYISNFFRSVSCKEVLVCDQIFGPYLSQYNKYSEITAKQVCVYRDPRDQFLSAFRLDLSVLPRSIDGFVNFYKNASALKFEDMLKNPDPNRLMVRFEDLVLKYDETVEKILNFVGIDKAHHIAPKSVFDPSISAVNIGAYKTFIDQDFMKEIEKRLPEYCYYPEKENLSKEAKAMLKGKSK